MTKKILFILIINTIISLCQDFHKIYSESANLLTNDAVHQNNNQNKNDEKSTSNLNYNVNDIYSNSQRIIDENECPRVSKFLDLIEENQTSLIQIAALEHIENSNILIVGTQSGDIELWDFQTRDILSRFSVSNQGAQIKQVMYLSDLDKILVLYDVPLSQSDDNQNQYSIILWDPQTQRQVFQFPKAENFSVDLKKQGNQPMKSLGNKVIDLQVKSQTETGLNKQISLNVKIVTISDTSIFICSISQNLNSYCRQTILNKSYVQDQPLKIFITDNNVFSIFTQKGLIQYNQNSNSYSALLQVQKGHYLECLYFPAQLKYILLKEDDLSMYLFDQDSQKDQMRKIIELNSLKSYFLAQNSTQARDQVIKIVKIQNNLPEFFLLLNNKTLIYINYEDDKILEIFNVENSNVIAPLKNSPSFFIAQFDGSISFYRQTVYLGEINLQQQNPYEVPNQLRRSISISYQSQSQQNLNHTNYYNYISEMQSNNFTVYHLSFQTISKIINFPIPFSDDYQIADFLVNFKSNIAYFYKPQEDILFICRINNLQNCTSKQLNMNQIIDNISFELKMMKFIHYYQKGGVLIVNNMNSIYIYKINEGKDIKLDDHLQLVFFQKLVTKSQTPTLVINTVKQRYQDSDDSILIFLGDESQFFIYEYNIPIKSLVSVQEFSISSPETKIVAIEVLQDEQLTIMQFIDNTYKFFNLKSKSFEKNAIKFEQQSNSFINFDFQLQIDLIRIEGSPHIISQLNNKRIIIFNYKTEQIHFMSDPLNNYVYQFKIDYLQQIFYVSQYSSTENISYYDLILQRPYLQFRQERGKIEKAQLFALNGQFLILQHYDYSFWVVDLEKQNFKPEKMFQYEKEQPNQKVAFFAREGQFTLINNLGKVYKYPFYNSQITGPPQIIESPCPSCQFDDKISIQNTTIPYLFMMHDSLQVVLYNSLYNSIIWYKKFDSVIVDVKSSIENCELLIGFQNRQIQQWNCQDLSNIFLQNQVVSQENIIDIQYSVEDSNRIYVISQNKIIFYDMKNLWQKVQDKVYNIFNSQQSEQSANLVFELKDCQILKSQYLKQLGVQILLTSKNQMIIYGFGQQQVIKLQSLTNDPYSIVFIGNTEDKTKIIISTTQKVWFINIGPLFLNFDYKSTKILDFYKQAAQISNNQTQSSSKLQAGTSLKFNNACLLNIYFQASSETRSMSVFGQGSKLDPYSHFSALQSLIIQVGLSNLIFSYKQNELNLRFFSHDQNLYHKISKRVNLQNSAFTQINFIGEKNTEDGKTVLEIEEGYELNSYMSVTFKNIIFKSIDFSSSTGFNNLISTQMNYLSDLSILQFSVLNIENLVFENVNFGLYSQNQNVPKYIQVTNCTKLLLNNSEFYGTSFYIDNVSRFQAQKTLIFGMKSDMISNEKQQVNLLKKKGIIFLRQLIRNKVVPGNKYVLQQINLENCQLNSIKMFAFECFEDQTPNLKAPSLYLNTTYMQHSSLIGLDNCRYLQDLLLNIQTVSLIDLSYKDSQILTDGYISISRIEQIQIRNTNKTINNFGSSASFLVQYSQGDTQIGQLILKNLYLSDTLLFQVSSNFSIVNTTIVDCRLSYSQIVTVQNTQSFCNVVVSSVNITNSIIEDNSKLIAVQQTLAINLELNILSLYNVTSQQSSLIQVNQDQSQIDIKIQNIFIKQSSFLNSKILEKGNQVFTNINKLVIQNNTKFVNSLVLKSSANIENQRVNLLNIPMFNTIEQLEISQCTFNESKIMEIKEQAYFYIQNLNLTQNTFFAQSMENNIQKSSPSIQTSTLNVSNNTNDKLSNKTQPDLPFFNNSSFPSISEQDKIRYLIEVTNIKIFNTSIVSNDFQGYIIFGQPQSQQIQSEIEQIYQNLNFSSNKFVPNSNFILLEINFNSLNRNSSVEVSNFTLADNIIDTFNPNIPLNQLEDGRSFFFFGSDKLGKVLLQNGVIKNNDNVGFVNIKYSLNIVTITNVNATGNLNKSSLQQSFLQVLHPRRFLMTQCIFERYNIIGSTFLSIQLNRQYFQLQNNISEDEKEQKNDIQIKENKNQIPQKKNVDKQQDIDLINLYPQEMLGQNLVKQNNSLNNFAKENHYIFEKRQLQHLSENDIDYQLEKENDQIRKENNQFSEENIDSLNRSYENDEEGTPDFQFDINNQQFNDVNINSNTDDSKEELYFVVFFDNKFIHLVGQNISQSISSSVINLQSNLLVNIFLENCLFLQNTVTSGQDYYRQRRLSQVEIQAVNSNIFLTNNQFIYGKFQLPITQFIDTVYFYLSAKYIQFQAYVQSFNHFKGQCNEYTLYNYMASGVLEGKNIKILNSTFNGTCTMIQPTLYIKLYDKSVLDISNSQFLDLYGIQEGSGLVINGVMNQVQINITNVTINRMSCPSVQGEGFFVFSNLKKGSVVNIKGVYAKQLYTQNGSLVKSQNDNIYISLKDVIVDNSFDTELFRDFLFIQNQIDQLKSKKSVQDYFNRLENGKFYPAQDQEDDSIINSDDDDININTFFLSSEKIEYGQNQLNQKRLLQAQEDNLFDESQDQSEDQSSLIDFFDVMNYMLLNQQIKQIQQKLLLIDSGQLIQIQNADVLKIINLKVRNYGIAFSSQNDLIYIYNVKNTLLNKLDIQNNIFYSSGAIRVSYSSVISKNSIFSNNKYYGSSLILFNQLLSSKNYMINLEINNNVCKNKISCFSPLLNQQSILHIQNTIISNNKGNNTVGGIFYSLPSRIFDISSIQNLQDFNKTIKNQNTISLKNLTIQNNNASQIGAMAIELGEDLSCKVFNSTFKKNYGLQIGGLSLQLHDPNSIYFENSTITENKSKFTGGVKIQKSSTLQLRNNFSQFIYNNTPNQFTSGPRSFQIIPVEDGVINDTQDQNSQNKVLKLAPLKLQEDNQTKSYKFLKKQEKLYEIQAFDSGDKLPQFYLKLFDENNQTMIGTQIPNVKVYLSDQSQPQQGSFLKGSDSYFYSYFGQSYNPNIGILFDQLQLYGFPGTNVTIVFKLLDIQYENASALVPFINPSQFYNFTINVSLRKCITGEYIKTSLITTECEMCAKQYYSLLDPHTYQNVKCLRCPDNCNCPGGDQLILEQGYWRDSNQSDVIIECKFSFDNCLGGLMVGDESCTNNRIGPLCEICDIKQGYTDLSASQCLNCKIIWLASLIMALILLFFIFYIFISIDSTVSRIRKFRILFEYSSANHIGQTSMLVKQFVSYLQVLSIISYFRFNFGKESISSIIYNIGNPLIGFNNIVSCFIYKYSKDWNIPHIYISFTVSLLIPISLSLVVLIAQMIINYRNYYYRKYYLITMILVNYFYFTPLLLSRAMELMICRQIGNEKYITASTIYNCKLDSFNKMNLFYFLPLIFLLLVAIPVLIIYRIKMRFQQNLPLKYFQYILGDFRKKYFYWEFVRFFTKIALVSLPVLFQEDIRTMGQVLNLILIIYYASVLYFHPFWTEICQKMELITGAAIFVTFHFCLLSYDKDDFSIWWWVTIIVISLTNIPLIFWYIISFFQAYKPSISKFFNYSPRRKMSESDDPQARARLLWQLALFTVKKHIKKEKLQALEAMKNKKRAKPLGNNYMDNSSFMTGYSDADQIQSEQKKSKLLWWRRSGRSSNQGFNNENKLNQSNLNQPLLQQNRYTIMENKLSQNSDDYNPYHDFNFSFLPQEDTQFSNQKTNQFKQ